MKLMELKEHPLLYPEALLGTKHDKLSSWDVVYSLNMATACLITYWIITYLLAGLSTSLRLPERDVVCR